MSTNTLIAFVHDQANMDTPRPAEFSKTLKQAITKYKVDNTVVITQHEFEVYAEFFIKKYEIDALLLCYDVVGLNQVEIAISKIQTLLNFVEAAYPSSKYYIMTPQGPPIIVESIDRVVRSGALNAHLIPFQILKNTSETQVHTLQEPDHLFLEELALRLGLRGEHPAFKRALSMAHRLAPYRQPILLQGETGTGKELFARLLHQLSANTPGPLITLNCATLPEALAESILMGHTKGAFTGAQSDQKGKFLQAHGGTLFLDEVAEMSLNVQAKLLRVIEDGFVDTLGSQKNQHVDIAIVCATHQNLKESVRNGSFRADLYYRLKVGCIELPSLRERRSDIPAIALSLLARVNAISGKNSSLSQDAVDTLCEYDWPGNIRELRNVIQSSVMLSDHEILNASDLQMEAYVENPDHLRSVLPSIEKGFALNDYIRDVRNQLIQDALKKAHGKQSEAAKLLGISPQAMSQYIHRS